MKTVRTPSSFSVRIATSIACVCNATYTASTIHRGVVRLLTIVPSANTPLPSDRIRSSWLVVEEWFLLCHRDCENRRWAVCSIWEEEITLWWTTRHHHIWWTRRKQVQKNNPLCMTTLLLSLWTNMHMYMYINTHLNKVCSSLGKWQVFQYMSSSSSWKRLIEAVQQFNTFSKPGSPEILTSSWKQGHSWIVDLPNDPQLPTLQPTQGTAHHSQRFISHLGGNEHTLEFLHFHFLPPPPPPLHSYLVALVLVHTGWVIYCN